MRNSSTIRGTRITLHGSGAEIIADEENLKVALPPGAVKEGAARVIIQKLIDTGRIKCDVMYEGNSVYSRKKIIRDVMKVVNNRDMKLMSDDLYRFLINRCGSIAHFSKAGWIDTYPSVDSLVRFFKTNEYGQSVLNSLPSWAEDARIIVKEIDEILAKYWNDRVKEIEEYQILEEKKRIERETIVLRYKNGVMVNVENMPPGWRWKIVQEEAQK